MTFNMCLEDTIRTHIFLHCLHTFNDILSMPYASFSARVLINTKTNQQSEIMSIYTIPVPVKAAGTTTLDGTHLQVLFIISARSGTSACVAGSQLNKLARRGSEPGQRRPKTQHAFTSAKNKSWRGCLSSCSLGQIPF